MTAAKRTIFKQLSLVQKALSSKGISKDQKNNYDKYDFRGIDDVLNAVGPIFAEHGVLLIPSMKSCVVEPVQTGQGKTTNRAYVEVEMTFYDEHGDSVTAIFSGEAMDRGDKAINKAYTAAYKYFLFEAFTIPVQGTEDADSETHEAVVNEQVVSVEQFGTLSNLLLESHKREPDVVKWLATGIQPGIQNLKELHAKHFDLVRTKLEAAKAKVEADKEAEAA